MLVTSPGRMPTPGGLFLPREPELALNALCLSRPQFPKPFLDYIERDYGFLREVEGSQCVTWSQVEERFDDAFQRWKKLPSRPLDFHSNKIGIPSELSILRALVEWFESFHGDSDKIALYDDSGNLTSKVIVPEQLTSWYEKVKAAWATDNTYSRAEALALTNEIFTVLRSEGSFASLLLTYELIGNLHLLLGVHQRCLEGDKEMVDAITQAARFGETRGLLQLFKHWVGNISSLPFYAISIAGELKKITFGGAVGKRLRETAQARQLEREQEFLAIYAALVHKLLETPTLEFKVHGTKEQSKEDILEGAVSLMLVETQHADKEWWGLSDLERSNIMGLGELYTIGSSWLSAKNEANGKITEITGRIKGLPSLIDKIRRNFKKRARFPLPLDPWGIGLMVGSEGDIFPTMKRLMELELTRDKLPKWLPASYKRFFEEGTTYSLVGLAGGRVKIDPKDLNYADLRRFFRLKDGSENYFGPSIELRIKPQKVYQEEMGPVGMASLSSQTNDSTLGTLRYTYHVDQIVPYWLAVLSTNNGPATWFYRVAREDEHPLYKFRKRGNPPD